MYKLVYFAFGFEAINSSEMRDKVMQHVLSWLVFGSISGKVDLQWRAYNSGTKVSLVGTNMSTLTKPDGSFVLLAVPEGEYEVEVTLPTYLTAKKSGIKVTQGDVTELPPLLLYGGDLNMDGKVDLLDLAFLTRNFNMTESGW